MRLLKVPSLKKQQLLSNGKAKSMYATDQHDYVIMRFRDDVSAFDGKKQQKLSGKGAVNNQFNAFIMDYLSKNDIPTHFETTLNDTDSIVKKLQMMPVECVVRNVASGSLCRRLNVQQGIELKPPVLEFFLKDDALHDPMINESHIITFGWADADSLAVIKKLGLKINALLTALFKDKGLILVDHKLEFGVFKGDVMLGDEWSPDGCRLWDVDTHKKLDKDRFRQDLGGVVDAYREVAQRIGVLPPDAAKRNLDPA